MRPTCSRCALPLRRCLCACVRALTPRLPLTVLQHPGEVAHAKGTVPLLKHCLGAACTVTVGPLTPPLPAGTVLLYPDAPAALTEPPRHLLLLDGSWRQSRALLRAHPALLALPRYALRAPPPSRYAALRRAHRPGQRSTLEAAACALAELAGDGATHDGLLAALDDWLGLQLSLRASGPDTPPCR